MFTQTIPSASGLAVAAFAALVILCKMILLDSIIAVRDFAVTSRWLVCSLKTAFARLLLRVAL